MADGLGRERVPTKATGRVYQERRPHCGEGMDGKPPFAVLRKGGTI